MLNRVWCKKNATETWKPKVEEHIYGDGTIHYSFRDRLGRPHDVADWNEAQQIIKEFKMEDVTEEMVADGWISKAQYEAFKKANATTQN